jgi:hypothetical protein
MNKYVQPHPYADPDAAARGWSRSRTASSLHGRPLTGRADQRTFPVRAPQRAAVLEESPKPLKSSNRSGLSSLPLRAVMASTQLI